MKKFLKVGMGFGLSSATITTLGLMIGLQSSTGSKLAVIGGILTIAVADSFPTLWAFISLKNQKEILLPKKFGRRLWLHFCLKPYLLAPF